IVPPQWGRSSQAHAVTSPTARPLGSFNEERLSPQRDVPSRHSNRLTPSATPSELGKQWPGGSRGRRRGTSTSPKGSAHQRLPARGSRTRCAGRGPTGLLLIAA